MTMPSFVKWLALSSAALLLGACASTGPRDGFAASDDYEPTSRFFHENNVRLDRYVLRPAAQGYDFVAPELIKHLVGNGLSHLELPGDFANYLLQGDIDRSLDTLGRFTLNTLMGAGGLLDPANEFGLKQQPTDFGITLGKYGVGEGTYLVLPLLGPTTVRDVFGFAVDTAFSPTFYIGQFTALDAFGPSITVGEIIHGRDAQFGIIDDLLYESEDSYVTLRSAFLQRRRAQIAGPDSAIDALPDLFDDDSSSN
ncbi:MAG: VacJ family lipoprotein [Pseudomonadota bacterium]